MAKFSGKIGYASTQEKPGRPGDFTEVIIERQHYGDIEKDFYRWKYGDTMNPDLTISNKVSIVADSFSINNTHNMRYIVLNGGRWDIISVDIDRPRLHINVGGVYNGPLPEST